MRYFYFAFILLCFSTCSDKAPVQETDTSKNNLMHPKQNLLTDLSPDNFGDFRWMNRPQSISFQNHRLQVIAEEKTDFFNNPEDQSITTSAPFFYQEISGDFVATAQVKPDFESIWNACALMVYQDSTHWVKFAFENSDATGKSIVSVVTNETSDDANGAILNDQESIWLKIIRKGNIYALHWSVDGQEFKMARLSSLPDSDTVKVGLEAQCPAGKAAAHEFLYFSLEQKNSRQSKNW